MQDSPKRFIMKYFTLRSPPRSSFEDGTRMNGKSFGDMNGDTYSSSHNVYKSNTQNTVPTSNSHYFYAQPRQKQRPQLAQHFHLKPSNNPQNRRSIVGNSNGLINGSEYDEGESNNFVAPKSAPLPRKAYNGRGNEHYNGHNEKLQNGWHEQNDYDYEGFAIPHNGTLPSKVRQKDLLNGHQEVNEPSSKLFSPFQKLLNRQKIRGVPFSVSKENLSSPEESENNANHKLYQYKDNSNDAIRNNVNNNNPEYGELREIVRRIEMQEQSQKEAQYLNKQVKHHPVLLVQQKLHHATTLSHHDMQNGFGNHIQSSNNVSNGGLISNGKVEGKPMALNKKKNSAFNYLTDSVPPR